MVNRWIRTAAFTMLTVSATPMQAQPAARVAESVAVTVVEIPVTVVDRAGNPVRGLTKENFELVDEGKKQRIEYFEEIDLARISASEKDPSFNPVARRNFMLLFDQENSTPGTIDRARDAALAFVKTEIGEHDLVSVATYNAGSGFRLLTSFTTDRALLAAAIETLGNPKFYQVRDPLLLSAASNMVRETGTGGAGERAETARIATEEIAELNRISAQNNDDYNRGRVRSQLKNFGGFARILDRVRGRKQVVLLSEGFDSRLIQGRESQGSADNRRDAEAVISGESWTVDNDQRFGSITASTEVTTMAELFKRSDVVLHAIDIKGLRTDVDAKEGTKRTTSESLYLMTNPTGGQVFKNANDLKDNFKKILRSQEVVYVLGFTAKPGGTPGKFHNLKVKTQNIPGGARAYHRAGYYEPSSRISALEQTLTSADILQSDIPQEDVALSVLSVPFPVANDKPLVPVIIEIAGRKLLEGVPGDSLNADLFVYAFDGGGAVRDFLHQKLSLDLSKVRAQVAAAGIRYYGSLRLDPGMHSIRVLIRVQESGRNGFQRSNLSVPKFGDPVVLAPIVWDEATNSNWLMVKGRPRSAAEVDYPFQIARQSFVPAVSASLQPNGSYKVAVFTYNVPREGLDIKASVRGADGNAAPAKVALLGVSPEGTLNATKLMLSFEPVGLAPGRYSLDVTIRQKANQLNQTLAVPFEVKPAS